MTANDILRWFGFRQGTATKRDIRRIWFSLPDNFTPFSEIERKFKDIGCEVE